MVEKIRKLFQHLEVGEMPEKYSKILEEGKNVRKNQFSGIFKSISDIFYSMVNFMTFWTPEINNLRYLINLTFVIIGIFWHFRALVNFLTFIWPKNLGNLKKIQFGKISWIWKPRWVVTREIKSWFSYSFWNSPKLGTLGRNKIENETRRFHNSIWLYSKLSW